jgi:hypothetical protein
MTQHKLAQIIGVAFPHIATALKAPIAYFFAADGGGSAHTRRPQ